MYVSSCMVVYIFLCGKCLCFILTSVINSGCLLGNVEVIKCNFSSRSISRKRKKSEFDSNIEAAAFSMLFPRITTMLGLAHVIDRSRTGERSSEPSTANRKRRAEPCRKKAKWLSVESGTCIGSTKS